jgi:hypothetical protein
MHVLDDFVCLYVEFRHVERKLFFLA